MIQKHNQNKDSLYRLVHNKFSHLVIDTNKMSGCKKVIQKISERD